MDVVSDEALDDRSSESWQVPVLDARSRNIGFGGRVSVEGMVAPRRGNLLESLLAPERYFWPSWSLDGLREGLRDKSGWA